MSSSRPTMPTQSSAGSGSGAGPIPKDHTPSTPSHLRESHTMARSPERQRGDSSTDAKYNAGKNDDSTEEQEAEAEQSTHQQEHPKYGNEDEDDADEGSSLLGASCRLAGKAITETTALLQKPFEMATHAPHPGPCNHGTFSPRLLSREGSIRSGRENYGILGAPSIESESAGGFDTPTEDSTGGNSLFNRLADSVRLSSNGNSGPSKGLRRRRTKKRSTTNWLAEQHGITNTTTMYLYYYVPFFAWIRQYKWIHFQGDLVAALTMASFYLPMALSYASNLAHVPPINGLYAFVFNPLIYAVLGSCPQMVVGPEAPGSLLVGAVVKSSVDNGKAGESDDLIHARVAGTVTGIAGAIIFMAGLTRLGFLDSVLSRPFLRGFISAIGFVIIVDQLIPEMGLVELADKAGISHGSSIDKLGFLIKNVGQAHGMTFAVAGISFVVIMTCRETKNRLMPRYPGVAYIPDRFFVVVLSAILSWKLDWESTGLEILGEVKSAGGPAFQFHWPFQGANMKHIQDAMSTSFLIALLGFFESSVAAKSLAGKEKEKNAIQGIMLSPNRELVALGVANLVGGCFGALPAFGGYGRSKVNASTGGKTPMSSILLSMMTIMCVTFLLPAFYYVPKAVLSSMITVVAYSLIEEAPHDIMFFIRVRGYTELGLMIIIFLATILYSLTLGIAIGIGLSIIAVIRHSTRPRIQIMGRVPGTNRFENAESFDDFGENPNIEFIEGSLIVKIPEPLTFANTGDLKSRLRRLEFYGTTSAHPALPRVRPAHLNRNIIFDIHGVTGLDGSGAQVLEEIVRGYRDSGVRVFFSRGPSWESDVGLLLERSGIVELCGGRGHFVGDVMDAIRASEVEEFGELGSEAGV